MNEQYKNNEMHQNLNKGETGMTTNNDNIKDRIFGMKSMQAKQKEAAERLAKAKSEKDKRKAEQELEYLEDVATLNAAENREISKLYDLEAINDRQGDATSAQPNQMGMQPRQYNTRDDKQEDDGNEPISDWGSFRGGLLTYTSRSISGLDINDPNLATAQLVLDALPQSLADALYQLAEEKNIHINMFLYSIILLLSTCLQGSVELNVNADWTEKANIFGMLLGETGSGKSTSVKVITKALNKIEAEMRSTFKRRQKYYEEKIEEIKNQKKGEKELPPKKPINRVVMITNITLEGMIDRFDHNPHGFTLNTDEYSKYFKILDKFSAAKGEFKNTFISCYSGETLRYYRKNHDNKCNDAFVECNYSVG